MKADLDAGLLERVLPGYKLSALEIWALLPAGRKSPPRARALVDLLARQLPSRLTRVT